MQRYILPYPPSLNRLYRTVRSRVYKTRVWRSWANDASAAIMSQLGADRPPMIAHPIAVEVAVRRPAPPRPAQAGGGGGGPPRIDRGTRLRGELLGN